MDEREGRPSHWNTLRAMRVLAWYEGSDLTAARSTYLRWL